MNKPKTTAEEALVFTDDVRCGFGVLDQDGRLKLNATIHLVLDRYGRALQAWGVLQSRGDYMATTGLSPVTTYLELLRHPHRLQVDDRVSMRFSAEYGFVQVRDGAPPRYGGRDRIEITDDNGKPITSWRQHWLWHRKNTGELLSEPAPVVPADQDREIAGPPARPRVQQPSSRQPFRWTPRETDMNQHINVAGYLERAENALADAGVDVRGITSVRLWFRRPAFLDDPMFTHLDPDSDPLLVEIRRADSEELCATLAFAN